MTNVYKSNIDDYNNNQSNNNVKDVVTIPIDKNSLLYYGSSSIHNHYNIQEKIGQGTWGSVYRVIDRSSNITRAMKKLPKKYKTEVHRFRREIKLLKYLDHPNIIKLYEYFEDSAYLYLILDICYGGELYSKIEKKKNLCEWKICHWMYQILSAISYLHHKGVIHRDIKLENFLFLHSNDDYLKLVDFGLSSDIISHTYLNSRVGTIQYSSPQVLKGLYTEKSDVWSAGVILYTLLCGYFPYDALNDSLLVKNICKSSLEFDTPVWNKISDTVKNLIELMLDKKEKYRISAQQALTHSWFYMLYNPIYPRISISHKIWLNDILRGAYTSRNWNSTQFILLDNSNTNPNFLNKYNINDIYNLFVTTDPPENHIFTMKKERSCSFTHCVRNFNQYSEYKNTIDNILTNKLNIELNCYHLENFKKIKRSSSEPSQYYEIIQRDELIFLDGDKEKNFYLLKKKILKQNNDEDIILPISPKHHLELYLNRIQEILKLKSFIQFIVCKFAWFSCQDVLFKTILLLVARMMQSSDNDSINNLRNYYLYFASNDKGSVDIDNCIIGLRSLWNIILYIDLPDILRNLVKFFLKNHFFSQFSLNQNIYDNLILSNDTDNSFKKVITTTKNGEFEICKHFFYRIKDFLSFDNFLSDFLQNISSKELLNSNFTRSSFDFLEKINITSNNKKSLHYWENLSEFLEFTMEFENLKKDIRNVSLNRENYLEYSEFLAFLLDSSIYTDESLLRTVFRLFDRDGDGTIRKNELSNSFGWSDPYSAHYEVISKVYLSQHGTIDQVKPLNLDIELNKIISLWTADHGNCITYSEFFKYIRCKSNYTI